MGADRLSSSWSPLSRIAVLLLASVVVGCVRGPKPLPPSIPASASEVDAILSALRSQEEGVRRAQGIVSARGRGPDGGFDARLVVIFERSPDRLRVELMGAFGGTRWTAVASESEITAYFPGRKQYLKESNVEDVVTRLLGLPLDPSEVMAIVSGVGVPIDDSTSASGERRGATTSLTFSHGPEGRSVVEVSADGQVLNAVTPTYRVSYPTSWKSNGRQIPDEVVIESPDVRTTLATAELDVNVALAPDSFALDVPADAARLRPAELEGEAVFVVEPPPRKRQEDSRLDFPDSPDLAATPHPR